MREKGNLEMFENVEQQPDISYKSFVYIKHSWILAIRKEDQ